MGKFGRKDVTQQTAFALLKQDGLDVKIQGAILDVQNNPVVIPPAVLTLVASATNYIYVVVGGATIEANTTGCPDHGKPLWEITTDGSEVVEAIDKRAVVRLSAHSACVTSPTWLQEQTFNGDVDWSNFDISGSVDIPAGATGIRMEVHVKEMGTVPAADQVFAMFRRPGETALSQAKLVAPQVSGRWFTRTVEVKFGDDGKTIQFKVDVDTQMLVKVGLAGWVYGH